MIREIVHAVSLVLVVAASSPSDADPQAPRQARSVQQAASIDPVPVQLVLENADGHYFLDLESLLHGICWSDDPARFHGLLKEVNGGISLWREQAYAVRDSERRGDDMIEARKWLSGLELKHGSVWLLTDNPVIHGGYRLSLVVDRDGRQSTVEMLIPLPADTVWKPQSGDAISLHASVSMADVADSLGPIPPAFSDGELCLKVTARRLYQYDTLTASK